MSNKRTFSPEVLQDSERYNQIWSAEKRLDSATIVLGDQTTHSCTLKCDVAVHRVLDGVEMLIDARGHWKKVSDYSFRLFDKSFMKGAIGRLDIIGGAHDNLSMNIPLKKIRVETPHFHRFLGTGYEFAYRTKTVETNQERMRVDRNVGLECFLEEENVRYKGTAVLACDSLLQPNQVERDPLKGVSFNE